MMTDNSILCESPIKYVEWRIQNFFEQPTPDDFTLNSALFYLSGGSWFLNTFTNDETDYSSSGWIGLVLLRKKTTLNHRVTCRIGIKKSNGSEFRAMNIEGIYCETANRWGSDHFIEKSKLVDYVDDVAPDGTLTVFCTLRIMNMPCTLSARVETASQTISDDLSPLCEDFKNIYVNKRCTDVILIVKEEEFHAHKTVLIARSPVFASMFDHNLSEKSSGKVEIPDCDPNSFKKFLFFLYTGKLDDVSLKNAVDLYKIAAKYDVKEIKEKCVHIMRRDLCVDSFCDVMLLPDMLDESYLFEDLMHFFVNNAETILQTTKWQQLLKENSSLDVFASSLSKDLKNIYINRRCTDVTLIVGNETFCAHRAILVARSSVFASMFEHNLSEKRSGEVEISDCDPDSFEEFLFFLYTGKLNDVPLEKAINLYKTADKYDIEKIKEECVHIMRHDLSADDFCDITHLAMMHRESELLKDATSFFIENAETILSTTKWAEFLDENPLICNELLLKLVKSKK